MSRKSFDRDPIRSGSVKKNEVIFKFKLQISDKDKKESLKKIRSWPEVKSVKQIFEGTNVLDSKGSVGWWMNLYVAHTKRRSQIKRLVDKLNALNEIDEAYVSPGRSFK